MDEKTYTLQDLIAMTSQERVEVFTKAVRMSGTGVVRDKDGNIKYDDPSKAGQYMEVNCGSNA